MSVVTHSLGESGVEVGLSGLQPLILHNGLHGRVDRVKLVQGIDIGNVASVENIVQILQERLTFYLGFKKQMSY